MSRVSRSVTTQSPTKLTPPKRAIPAKSGEAQSTFSREKREGRKRLGGEGRQGFKTMLVKGMARAFAGEAVRTLLNSTTGE